MLGQIVNFIILLFLLKRFVYKPLLNVLDKRKTKIEEGVRKSEEAGRLMEKTMDLSKNIREKGHQEARSLIIQAELKAKERSQVLLAEAEKEKNKIIDSAKEAAKEETRKTAEDRKKEAVEIAFVLAGKFLKEKIDESKDKKIIEELIKK